MSQRRNPLLSFLSIAAHPFKYRVDSRRQNLIVLFLCLAVAAINPRVVNAEEAKKNVLFLMSDEHSGRVMGAAGNSIVKTPTVDALADEGVLFQNAYCQNPICVPSRASLATGKMPSKVDVFSNRANEDDVLRDAPLTLARVFTDAGYTAEWLGKEHWGTDNEGIGFGGEQKTARKRVLNEARSFLDFRKEIGRLPERARKIPKTIQKLEDTIYTDHALSWLDDYDGTKPFFLGLSLYMPHFPFIVEKKYYDMYKDLINVPIVSSEMIEDMPSHNQKHREKYGFQNLRNWQIKKARAMYYGMVSYVDEQFGRVIQKLEEKGLRNDTIIVYVSDHGEQAGEHGLWYKNSFYEDSVKVPMILSYPNSVPSKTKLPWPVQLIDIVPTLYEMCGIGIPDGLDGRSLVPLLTGQEDGRRRQAVSESYSGQAGRMIRIRRWKYCWYEDGKHQLFDLLTDPAEEHNLYNNTKLSGLIKNLHRRAMEGYIPKPKPVARRD